MAQWHSDVRIQHNEFQIEVIGDIRNPLFTGGVPSGDIDVVDDVIKDFILSRLVRSIFVSLEYTLFKILLQM